MTGRTVYIGETIRIEKAYAQDVLFGASKVTVTVSTQQSGVYNNMNKVVLDEAVEIPITEYGYYTITYIAEDINGAITRERVVFYSKDITPPTISIQGSVPSTMKVGETIQLPNATVSDNSTNNPGFTMMVICPDGASIKIENGKFTAYVAGKHQVVYFVHDKDYNIATQKFDLEVR